jgi:hypothetical protein
MQGSPIALDIGLQSDTLEIFLEGNPHASFFPNESVEREPDCRSRDFVLSRDRERSSASFREKTFHPWRTPRRDIRGELIIAVPRLSRFVIVFIFLCSELSASGIITRSKI